MLEYIQILGHELYRILFLLVPILVSVAMVVWSPRGDLIAFTKMRKGRFYIGVMRTDGSGERLLTENYYQEAPSWSPNGRVLVFYRETKAGSKGEGFSATLWSIDITGYNERKLTTKTDASDPSWSSLLSK